MSVSRRQTQGPKFIRYFDPVVQALKQLGGSGRTPEVIQLVAKLKTVPESEQQEVLKSGGLRFDNQVQFARQYLVWAGLIDKSVRGVWSLTESGWKVARITDDQALELFRREHAAHTGKEASPDGSGQSTEIVDVEQILENKLAERKPHAHREKVLAKLRKLTPKGFEHFCLRLLRAYEFEDLLPTGGPKDKGIDGIGTLRINPFISISVVIQCKRYAGNNAVTSKDISTFRGSIPNSVDKGIFIATSEFTADARSIARDSDKKPIELISGNKIVDLLEELKLGLRTVYELDETFFNEFDQE